MAAIESIIQGLELFAKLLVLPDGFLAHILRVESVPVLRNGLPDATQLQRLGQYPWIRQFLKTQIILNIPLTLSVLSRMASYFEFKQTAPLLIQFASTVSEDLVQIAANSGARYSLAAVACLLENFLGYNSESSKEKVLQNPKIYFFELP